MAEGGSDKQPVQLAASQIFINSYKIILHIHVCKNRRDNSLPRHVASYTVVSPATVLATRLSPPPRC